MKYYSAIRKNEILLFAGKWMELEIMMLGEISQTKKNKLQTQQRDWTLST
jgi:hypothetical protein